MRRNVFAIIMLALSAGPAFASGYSELNLGIIYHERADWDAVIQHLTAALIAPDLPAAYRSTAYSDRGDAYFEKDDLDKAISDYSAALAADPDYLQALIDRGAVYVAQKKFDLAVADFSALIARRPTRDVTYVTRGRVYELQKKYDLAIADFSSVIKLSPSSATGYIMRGYVRRMADQYDASVDDYSKAIDINSDLTGAYIGRALAYRDQGNYTEALRDLQTAQKTKPSSDELMDLGVTQWEVGRFADAAQTFAQAQQVKDSDAYALLWHQLATLRAGGQSDPGFKSAAAAFGFKKWPGPILNVYLGAAPQTAMKAAADPDAETQSNQVCEANFYIAEWHVLVGDKTAAIPMLQAAQAQCPHEFIERDGAAAELKRLQ